MPDFESGAFNRALPPLRDLCVTFSKESLGPAAGNSWREVATSEETALAFHCLGGRKQFGREYVANAHLKFTGLGGSVAILPPSFCPISMVCGLGEWMPD
jgi:hypothetical protein